jgi:hypothetical protein
MNYESFVNKLETIISIILLVLLDILGKSLINFKN